MMPSRGLSCPVRVLADPDWSRDYAGATTSWLISLSDDELSRVDPLAVNLIVARGISSLSDIDVADYQLRVNDIAEDFRSRYLPYWQQSFDGEPHCYRNKQRFFQVGMLAQYLHQELGIRYIPEQREASRVRYTNPSDLFVNGVLDTFEGTCANLAALAVAIGWRMAWPVSLACVHSHYVLRYDDGCLAFNIEVTGELEHGFSAPEDHDLIADYSIAAQAIECGSDLRALRPCECLGVYLWQRARHYRDVATESRNAKLLAAVECDLMLSRYLFPEYRQTHRAAAFQLAYVAEQRFAEREAGHPSSYRQLISEVQDYRSSMDTQAAPRGALSAVAIQDQALQGYIEDSKGVAQRC